MIQADLLREHAGRSAVDCAALCITAVGVNQIEPGQPRSYDVIGLQRATGRTSDNVKYALRGLRDAGWVEPGLAAEADLSDGISGVSRHRSAFWRRTSHFASVVQAAHNAVLFGPGTPDNISGLYRTAVVAWAAADGVSENEQDRLRAQRIEAVTALGEAAVAGPPFGEHQLVRGILAWDLAVQVAVRDLLPVELSA